jgi:DNA-binding NarL/FixJ family response regulator
MRNDSVKIGIAEDQTMFRMGLVKLLNELDNVEVVFDTDNGQNFINQLEFNDIDIAFLDYKMPILNGIKTSKLISEKFPRVKILFISMYNDEEFIISAIENGANGYITKDEDIDEIEVAIKRLVSTGYYMNDSTSKLLIGNLLNNGQLSPSFNKTSSELNEQELQVVKLICQEYTTREISGLIYRGVRTVEGIRSSILRKTGTKNSSGIVMYAIKKGIVEV